MNDGLKAAREARNKRKEAGLKATMDPIEKLARNPASLRLSINAKCYDCEGQDADHGIKWRIGNCTISDCGLWNVRPYQKLSGMPAPSILVAGTSEDTSEGR